MGPNDNPNQHRFLENNLATTRRVWLPTADDAPELADLRAEHERLVAVVAEAGSSSNALTARREAEEEARRAAQEAEFLGRSDAKLPPITVTDEELVDARVRASAAKDALQTFVRQAVTEIRERSRVLRAGFEKVAAEAEAKREQARVLMAEAQTIEVSTKRLDAWLARIDGRSPLGHIAWVDLPSPVPIYEPTLAELAEAARPAMGDVIELESGVAFGAVAPDDLDDDATPTRPYEIPLPS